MCACLTRSGRLLGCPPSWPCAEWASPALLSSRLQLPQAQAGCQQACGMACPSAAMLCHRRLPYASQLCPHPSLHPSIHPQLHRHTHCACSSAHVCGAPAGRPSAWTWQSGRTGGDRWHGCCGRPGRRPAAATWRSRAAPGPGPRCSTPTYCIHGYIDGYSNPWIFKPMCIRPLLSSVCVGCREGRDFGGAAMRNRSLPQAL